VPGLDTVLRGGFLRGGQGSPGTGKTILASQIIYTHAAQGRRALFVTVLGENHGRMMQHLRPMRFFDPSLVPEPVKQWASAGSTARRCGVPLVSHERAHPGRTRPSSARRRSVAGWWPRRRLRLIWRRGLSDSQLAPGNTYSSNCNCPGHVGLQHTRLDRDAIADDRTIRLSSLSYANLWRPIRRTRALRSIPGQVVTGQRRADGLPEGSADAPSQRAAPATCDWHRPAL
jgi:KaiC